MGTQAAGRGSWRHISSPVCRTLVHGAHTYRGQAALVQRPHHLTTCRSQVSLCVCQRLSCSGSPPRVMPSSFTAAALLPFRLLSPLHTPAWRLTRQSCNHPRRLHAHAAHRVPTTRADRPPCRPDTGMRLFCSHTQHSLCMVLHLHLADIPILVLWCLQSARGAQTSPDRACSAVDIHRRALVPVA
jgi:hypothetical protein